MLCPYIYIKGQSANIIVLRPKETVLKWNSRRSTMGHFKKIKKLFISNFFFCIPIILNLHIIKHIRTYKKIKKMCAVTKYMANTPKEPKTPTKWHWPFLHQSLHTVHNNLTVEKGFLHQEQKKSFVMSERLS